MIPKGRLAWLRLSLLVTVFVIAVQVSVVALNRLRDAERRTPDLLVSLPDSEPAPREKPDRFPPDFHLPPRKEMLTCGPAGTTGFEPAADLVQVADSRVWWESDNDTGDTEDDHLVHRSLAAPLRRLIDMVASNGAVLKVQDSYRPAGIHRERSLHREGRAVDLTCDELGLEELARLCWVAGFDWVYHESGGPKGGAHVHCSVRARRPAPRIEVPLEELLARRIEARPGGSTPPLRD